MREITPVLTNEIEQHCGKQAVSHATPYEISNFQDLVKHVARLAHANHDELLFFRGQDKDFQNKAGGTTLYPSIYRGDPIPSREIAFRFEQLTDASQMLVRAWEEKGFAGYKEIRRKTYIQWSILQHYGVVDTPLLDITQSLRVACSFAQLESRDSECYIYILGLPYVTNRISINSEHDIVNIRLLSICPQMR